MWTSGFCLAFGAVVWPSGICLAFGHLFGLRGVCLAFGDLFSLRACVKSSGAWLVFGDKVVSGATFGRLLGLRAFVWPSGVGTHFHGGVGTQTHGKCK